MKNISIVYAARFLFLLSTFSSVFVSAQTLVGGDISTNTTWSLSGSPYEVNVNVLVDEGVTLTIDPGVVIKFDPAKAITIRGTLRAIGNSSSYITFTSSAVNPQPADWGYILFDNESAHYDSTTNDGCILDYCIIQFAGNTYRYVVHVNQNNPRISHSVFSNNLGSCLDYNSNDSVRVEFITDNVFSNNINKGGQSIISDNSYTNFPKYYIITGNLFMNNDNTPVNIALGQGIFSNNIISNNAAIAVIFLIGNFRVERNLITCNSSDLIYQTSDEGLIYISSNEPFRNNIIANNLVKHEQVLNLGNYSSGETPIENNQVIGNTVYDGPYTTFFFGNSFAHNTITQNYSHLTADNIVLEGRSFYHNNNLYNNYHDSLKLYCTEAATPISQSDDTISENYWGTSITTDIDSCMFDYFDSLTLGVLVYQPFLVSPDTSAPISPPINFSKKDLGNGDVQLTWNANPENDVAGYKIYWGQINCYTFAHVTDVGNVTSYTMSNANYNDIYTITAYDLSHDGVNDQFDGNESWYSYDQLSNPVATAVPSISSPKASVSIYPNPMRDAATIETKNLHVPFQFQLYDVLGNLVGSETVTTDRFLLYRNELGGGIYFFRITKSGESLAEGKIVME